MLCAATSFRFQPNIVNLQKPWQRKQTVLLVCCTCQFVYTVVVLPAGRYRQTSRAPLVYFPPLTVIGLHFLTPQPTLLDLAQTTCVKWPMKQLPFAASGLAQPAVPTAIQQVPIAILQGSIRLPLICDY